MKYKKLYLKFWLKAFGKDNGELPPPSASTAWNPIFYALAIGVPEIIVDPMEFAMIVNGKPDDVKADMFDVIPQTEARFVGVGKIFGIEFVVDRRNHKLPKE